jgi:hypothetical protein
MHTTPTHPSSSITMLPIFKFSFIFLTFYHSSYICFVLAWV